MPRRSTNRGHVSRKFCCVEHEPALRRRTPDRQVAMLAIGFAVKAAIRLYRSGGAMGATKPGALHGRCHPRGRSLERPGASLA